MAQIWPLNPVRRREWPVCGARVCGEQDSGRSTLRFTILPRAALFEKAICGTTTCGRQQRCTQRIGTRDPRPAEASRSLAMRGLFHTPAARDSDMHVASMSLQNTTRDGVQPRRWRFVYFTPQERMLRASGRCECCTPDSTSRESQSFRWHLRYATDGYSTLVVEVSDDDNDGEEDVDDGERLHYDDASWRARYIL